MSSGRLRMFAAGLMFCLGGTRGNLLELGCCDILRSEVKDMKRVFPWLLSVVVACFVIGTASAACVGGGEHRLDAGETVAAPTCTRKGSVVYACTNEGCTYRVEREVEKKPHVYVNGVCTCGVRKKLPFTDVAGHWGEQSVRYVYYENIMHGVHATRFAPDETLTRGMVVTVLYNMEGKPAVSGKSPFRDVKENIWYSDPVIWAEENGIVYGMGDGTFAPDQFITREQMASIMRRYAGFKGEDTSAKIKLSAYSDAGKISGWAVRGMKWAVQNGIMSGKGNGIMDPLGKATRAECAKIIYNFLER